MPFIENEHDIITNSIYQCICETYERTASRDLDSLTEQNIFEKLGEKKVAENDELLEDVRVIREKFVKLNN